MILKKRAKSRAGSQQPINESEQEETEGQGWQPEFYNDSKEEQIATGMWLSTSSAQPDKYRSTIYGF